MREPSIKFKSLSFGTWGRLFLRAVEAGFISETKNLTKVQTLAKILE